MCLEKTRNHIQEGEVPLRNEQQKKSKYWIIPLCILLLILVFTSGILLGTRLAKFTNVEPYTEVVISDKTDGDQKGDVDKTDEEEKFIAEPGMSIETDLSIFCATYGNENEEITVRSLGEDKVVAPGTANSHIIRIANTGNCALDYELNVKDLFPNTATDRVVPIEIRMTDYSGKYVIGDEDTWKSLEEINVTCDTGTVGKNCYVYYTLEWRWPYEGDENVDLYDTMLGTLSNTEKIECGITLTTTAELNENPDAEGGFWAPKTGDTVNHILWVSLIGASLLLLFIILFYCTKREHKEEQM